MDFNRPCKQIVKDFRILAENALECIWTYDISADRFSFVSPSVQKLTGFSVEEVMQKPLSAFLPKNTLEKVRDTIALFMDRYQCGERREDQLTHCDDYEILCKDQTAKQVEITARLLYSAESRSLELLGITRDVTRCKQLEKRLSRALKIKNEMIRHLRDSEKASKNLAEELNQKNEILRSHATRDTLTGACNRYFFDQKVAEEECRCRRYQYPLSVVLLDIDGFKEINDTLGHQIGDSVLIGIVDAIQKNIRVSDTLARWGGDEFILLMPQTPLSEAVTAAEKLRQIVVDTRCEAIPAAVTASFGVVELLQGESADSWFRRLDYALFRSKSNGRNRVTAMDWKTAVPFVQIRLEWKSDWECGNPTIDGQHKQLVVLGNRLLDSALSDINSRSTAEALDELVSHIQTHFESEERVLKELAYPNVDEHAKIHHALIGQTQALLTQHRERALKSSSIFSFILDEVVMGHLLKEDIRFFPHVKSLSARETPVNAD